MNELSNHSFFDAIRAVQKQKPLIHCLLSPIAMNWAANIVLAINASPIMAFDAKEVAEIAAATNSVTINIGILTKTRASGLIKAAEAAQKLHKPLIFDPVGHFASAFRRQISEKLLAFKPVIIKGNASEIIALDRVYAWRGVDSVNTVVEAKSSAISLAKKFSNVTVVTGETDFITDGSKSIEVKGGNKMMAQVTAMGCALNCVIGAFAAVLPEKPMDAAVFACQLFAKAGEKAATHATGPGTFAVAFLDAISLISNYSIDQTV